jgi:DNA repair protein RecN (Recombination protein N)
MLQRSWQRRVLDDSGDAAVAEARGVMSGAHRRWRGAEARLAEARLASHRTAAELAEAEATIAELEPLRLRDGEEDDLGAERLRLRHATGIARAATLLGEAASGDDAGAADVLERALAEVDALSGVDAGLANLGGEAAALTAALRDLGVSARRLADRVEVDPARLEAVEERLDTLARIRRRHGSIRAALTALEGARRICDAARGGQDLVALEAEARAGQAGAAAAAGRLSAARRDAARALERAVERHLAVMELPDARFRVTLGVIADADGLDLGDGPVRCDADGVDQVEMRLAANRGGVPLPLDEGPSGGELSRLALALAAAGGGAGQPLLVLDEVDTGVGGETAARVGDLLAVIGRRRQVVAVTHRPEIAARAGWHLLVSRTGGGATVESGVRRVEGQERVAEVARMMSGRSTAAALARAAELLREGEAPGGRRQSAG